MTTIILGMHRSGTSVLGNILSELGWSIGLSPMLASDENPQGFFENRSIMQLHDALLFEANSTWSDPHPLPPDHWMATRSAYWSARISGLLEAEFPGVTHRLIKDPRMCRLLPPWRKALGQEWERTLFFLPLRHPMEVAASLQARDGMSLEYGVLLWLTHFFEAEIETRGTSRMFLLQDRLIGGLENQRIAGFCGSGIDQVTDAHSKAVSPGLRHHYFRDERIMPGTSLGDLASRAWDLATGLVDQHEDFPALDELRARYLDQLGFVPREFSGSSTTGSGLPANPIGSYLEGLSHSGDSNQRQRAFLHREGDRFSVRFKTPPIHEKKWLWRVVLPGPCEMAITSVRDGHKRVSLDDLNAFDQKDGFARFLEGEAHFRIQIDNEPGTAGSQAAEDLEIVGTLRLIPPNALGREFAMCRRTWSDPKQPKAPAPTQPEPQPEPECAAPDADQTPASPATSLLLGGRLRMPFLATAETTVRPDTAIADLRERQQRMTRNLQGLAQRLNESRGSFARRRSDLFSRSLLSIKRLQESARRDQSRHQALKNHPLSRIAARFPSLFRLSPTLRRAHRQVLASGLFDERHYRSQCVPHAKIRDPLMHYLVIGWRFDLAPSPLIQPDCLRHLPGKPPLLSYLKTPTASELCPNPLFDPVFYLNRHPDVGGTGMHPLVHFLKHGAAQAFNPSPLFDLSWYVSHHPESIAKGRNPLAHYMATGAFEGCNPNPLFDSEWYLTEYPESGAAGSNPLEHFLKEGCSAGCLPNPLFDTRWYLARYPEVARSGINPLHHYLATGAAEGFNPNPLFDSGWYLSRYPEVAQAGLNPLAHYRSNGWREGFHPNPLFDPAHYLAQLPDEQRRIGPLEHYLATGTDGLLSPHPLFDPAWYLENNPAVEAAGINPLVHFIGSGAAEGLNPHPLFNSRFYRRQHAVEPGAIDNPLVDFLLNSSSRSPSALFDTRYYLSRYPAAAEGGTPPLLHFLQKGAGEGCNPSALFDTSYYIEQHGHLLQAGENPLIHYRRTGERMGCKPNPLFDPEWYSRHCPAARSCGTSLLEHYIETGASQGFRPCPLFDTQWYLEKYPQVAHAGQNPLAHYLATGASEGFKPNALFDSAWYLTHYPQVASHGFNPLAHYLTSGATEGYNPNPLFDSNWYVSSYPQVAESGLPPLQHYFAIGAAAGLWPNPLFAPEWYVQECPEAAAWDLNPLAHYIERGSATGTRPHPLFDPAWYRETYPEVAAAGIEPFSHFMVSGAREGFSPHPLFDVGWYLQQYPAVGKSGCNPLAHYMNEGAWTRLDPCPLFNSARYLNLNPDVREAGVNPLVHYVSQIASSSPSPHTLFDTAFYLAQCPEIANLPIPPLAHYLTSGALKGLDPHPLFNTSYYLETYPEVAENHINPLVHYLASGAREGRNPSPLFDAKWYWQSCPGITEAAENPLLHYLENGVTLGLNPCPMFDGTAYLEKYPEVAESGANPLLHYLSSGEAEGRLVPGRFDPLFYQKQLGEQLPETSLLEHYIRYGAAAGLAAAPVTVLFDLASPAYLSLPEEHEPLVSIVIPVHNQFPFTLNCLDAIAKAETMVPYEVIVVDDGSTDETATLPYRVFNLRCLRNEINQGFGATCNRGAAAARGQYVVFLNNDTRVGHGWLDALVHAARLPGTGYVGAKLVYPDGRLQEAGGIIWQDGSAWNYGNGANPAEPQFNYLRKADYCSAAAALVPAALFSELGGFSPEYERAYYEDTDLCMRIRATGRNVIYQPLAEVTHFEGGTCGTNLTSGVKQYQVTNRGVFVDKWQGSLASHPENGDLPGHFKHLYPAGTILFIDDLLPFPKISSGGQRAWNILVVLLKLGYHVTFLPACECAFPVDEQRELLQRMGVQVLGPPAGPTAAAWLEDQHHIFTLAAFDKVIVARHYIAARLYPQLRGRMPRASIIFDTVDLHYMRLRREAEITRERETLEKAAIAYTEEIELLELCEQTWVVSEVEKTELLSIRPDADVRVVSNIVDVPGTRKDWHSRSGMLFIGGFNHPPNQDAVLWFLKEVFPLVLQQIPDAIIHILGSNMPEEFHSLASAHINPVGFVDDPAVWFDQVRLSVAPLRYGAGVKGKVNQSLSLGVPVVGTRIAFEGMGLPPETCVLSAEDPALMAQHVIRLYNDQALWEAFSAEGVRLMRELYSVEFAEQTISDALKRLPHRVATPEPPNPTP